MTPMTPMTPINALGWVAGVMGKDKSFRNNPILGSERLNRLGLHKNRVALADRLNEMRRAVTGIGMPVQDRADYDENGFILRENFLPAAEFEALRAELYEQDLPAREMRQGQTVTRMIPLSVGTQGLMPVATSVVRGRELNRMSHYVAGRSGAVVAFVQTVLAEPSKQPADPQTALHADTFHSTAKYWLFLHDVGEEDGPFIFVPGSHRVTPERLAWEYEQSLGARKDPRLHHSLGSFRIAPNELAALGYGAPQRMVVKANTLIVADTFAFHSRAPSTKATTRVELHGYLRRNPFAPWNGMDVTGLPGIKNRQLDLFHGYSDWQAKRKGREPFWQNVGRIRVDAEAQI